MLEACRLGEAKLCLDGMTGEGQRLALRRASNGKLTQNAD
jgi:hypothetical protein